MNFFYWLALVLGGGLLGLSLISSSFGAHSDTHLGGTHDVDLTHHDDFDWGKLLSLRNLTYLLFAFGATGVLLRLIWGGEKGLITALAATVTGVTAWFASATLFGYLKSSESGERLSDRALVGRVGQITLPLLPGGTGKVQITRSGQTQELLAKPMDESEANPQGWGTVVIVEMRDGIAFVAPYSEANSSEN
jgi:hypothetical protein